MLWFLERISATSSEITFGSEERRLYPADFEKLIKLGILQQTHNLEMVDCALCDEPHETAVRALSDKLYYVCENGCGRKDLEDTDVAIFTYNATNLILLFQKAIGISKPQSNEIEVGILWDLGAQSVNEVSYHLFFCRNLEAIEPMQLPLIANQPHSTIFYTGQPITLPDTVYMVPLIDCIVGIDEGRIAVSKNVIEQYFPHGSYAQSTHNERSKRAKHTVEVTFSEKVQWEKVTIKIKEGMTDAEILYDGRHLATASHAELGFAASAKQQKPDRKWQFLTVLSAVSFLDPKQATPLNLANALTRQAQKTITVANVHTIKKQLSERLMEIFETDEDPFTENKEYYVPRFKLLPSPSLRNHELRRQGGEYKEDVNYADIEA